MRISDWSSDVCSSDLIEPLHCGLTQIDRLVAHDHIGKRAAFERSADPKPMRPVDVAQDQMTAGGEHAVGKDDRPGVEVEPSGFGKACGRRIEDGCCRRDRRLPERWFVSSERARCTGESTIPSAGPPHPAPPWSLPPNTYRFDTPP